MKLLPDLKQAEPGLLFWITFQCVLTITSWNLISMIRNYLRVRFSQIPAYLCPVNPFSIPWLILGPPLQPLLQRILPTSLFDRIKPTFYGWEFAVKYSLHAKFGKIFFLSNPSTNDLRIVNSTTTTDILKRPKGFIPLPGTEIIVGLFGPNLITSHGEQWAQQRRLIAPNFNEGISSLVWNESRAQTTQMLFPRRPERRD